MNTDVTVSHADVPSCGDVNTLKTVLCTNVSTVNADATVLNTDVTVPNVTMQKVSKVNMYSRSRYRPDA